MLQEGKRKLKIQSYGKLRNKHFPRKYGNKQDLNKIEAFLDDNFNGFVNRYGDTVDAEFDSRWEYPEKEINELIALLVAKDKIYIRILTYELEDEYVSFRIFSQGKWNIKLS